MNERQHFKRAADESHAVASMMMEVDRLQQDEVEALQEVLRVGEYIDRSGFDPKDVERESLKIQSVRIRYADKLLKYGKALQEIGEKYSKEDLP